MKVMGEPCPETAGTVGAADIDVESGLKLQAAEPADPDGGSFGGCENEGVGSGLGRHWARVYLLGRSAYSVAVRPASITPDYERQADRVVELQLERAGVRLAWLLNRALKLGVAASPAGFRNHARLGGR